MRSGCDAESDRWSINSFLSPAQFPPLLSHPPLFLRPFVTRGMAFRTASTSASIRKCMTSNGLKGSLTRGTCTAASILLAERSGLSKGRWDRDGRTYATLNVSPARGIKEENTAGDGMRDTHMTLPSSGLRTASRARPTASPRERDQKRTAEAEAEVRFGAGPGPGRGLLNRRFGSQADGNGKDMVKKIFTSGKRRADADMAGLEVAPQEAGKFDLSRLGPSRSSIKVGKAFLLFWLAHLVFGNEELHVLTSMMQLSRIDDVISHSFDQSPTPRSHPPFFNRAPGWEVSPSTTARLFSV